MSRLPIRIRLTLAFTLVMAVVLAAMSFFVYARVGSTLLASIDQSLRAQTVDVAHLDRGRRRPRRVGRRRHRRRCSVPAAPSSRPTRPGCPACWLPARSRSVAAGERVLRSQHLPGLRERWRVLAQADDGSRTRRRPWSSARSLGRARRDARPPARRAAGRRAAGAVAGGARRLRARRRRAAPGRGDARPRGGDLGARRRERGCRSRRPGRDLPARRDAERDARPARGRLRARAAVRRRRQPRAADAARVAEDRARGRAAPAAARARSSSTRYARPPRRPSGCRGWPRTCC